MVETLSASKPSVAKNSWLGTKDDLKDLCAEAEKYGVKIICDIVSNHMGSESEDTPNVVSSQVKTYAPDIYDNASAFFRNNKITVSDSSVENVVQGHLNSCPDLNTNSTVVQNKVISLLKECIDCGVDGFRFDAAKHIETPDDGDFASDYWKNITESAGSYYKAKQATIFIFTVRFLTTAVPAEVTVLTQSTLV